MNEAYKKKADFIADVYEWFKNSLKFIVKNTNTELKSSFLNDADYREELCHYLYKYDTEICKIILNSQDENNLENNIAASKLNFIHKDIKGNTACFDFKNESDGIKRLIGLLPILVEPCENENTDFVYIVDDIDRNLHPNLLQQFMTNFLLQSSAKSHVQLIATTNNSVLMDT